MNREDQAVSVAAWLGESLALVAISALVLAWMVPAVDRRLPPARKEPLWLPQLAFVALATFLLCTLVVPALIVKAFGASDGAPSPELGTFATAVANLLAIGLTLVVARRRFDATAADVALARPRPLALAFGALAIVAAFPAFLGISFVNLRLTEALGLEPHQALVQTLLDDREFLSRPWVLASIVLVVPFCEELLFRGLLQRALRVAMPAAPAILASSFLFAVVHDPQSLLPVFTIGVVLGIVVEVTGSVWAATLAHGLFNAVNLATIARDAG